MKKKLLSLLLSLTLLFTLAIPCLTPTASAAYSPGIFAGSSWYGRYSGSNDNYAGFVERYMNMTISTCDANGNITGIAYVTTAPGQYDTAWIKYEFRGTINLNTGAFTMQGTKELSSSDFNWQFFVFSGTYSSSRIQGTCDGEADRTFLLRPGLRLGKDELTAADSLGLIPDTLYGKDLSSPSPGLSSAQWLCSCMRTWRKQRSPMPPPPSPTSPATQTPTALPGPPP